MDASSNQQIIFHRQFYQFLGWVMVAAIGFAAAEFTISYLSNATGLGVIGATNIVMATILYGARRLIRRDRIDAAVAVVCLTFQVEAVLGMLSVPDLLVVWILFPIATIGIPMLFTSQRMFRLIGGSSVITAMLIVVTSLFPPLFAPPLKLVIDVLNVITVLVIMMLLVFFFGFIWQQLTTRLERMRVINADLNTLRADLERQVAARTGDLEQALVQVKAQAAEQAQLLAENEQQRTLIREMSVPILPVSGTTLVMPLVGALDSRRLLDMREQALLALQRLRAKTLLLDLTGVPLVDTQVAEGLIGVVTASRLLGAEVVLIGIRPEVAQTIVSLGVDLHSVRTISDLQSALAAQYTTRSGMPMPGQL